MSHGGAPPGRGELLFLGQGEQEWHRIRGALDLGTGFQFLVVTSPSRVALDEVADRIDRMRRGAGLQRVSPGSTQAIRTVGEELDELGGQLGRAARRSVVWIDAWHTDKEREEAWRFALARINERRNYWGRRLGGAVVLAGPPVVATLLTATAPDLWSVRTLVAHLPEVVLGQPEGPRAEAHRPTARPADPREPERLVALADAIASKVDPAAVCLRSELLGRAAASLRSKGEYDRAAQLAGQAVAIVETLARERPSDRVAGRALATALVARGTVLLARRDLDGARQDLERSLEIRERVAREFGETPEALRDLGVSLSNLGDVRLEQRDLDAAGRAFERSLEIDERVAREFGETPEALRDLSVSLNKLGALLVEQRDLDAAGRAF
ncbi:MAG: tetratricopeptide repeat protein, partial [Deltaproteobacteria bacterium]|nr:tetratricopeptide repeat protein [Deltaproteobacteria bacterium]